MKICLSKDYQKNLIATSLSLRKILLNCFPTILARRFFVISKRRKKIKKSCNSIKESISAVEALCREITTENTLGDALKKLEKNGVNIPAFLKSGFEKLYIYTNNEKTGIRHALMDNTETPQYDEAKFMLVSCCAFVNYIQGKRSTIR